MSRQADRALTMSKKTPARPGITFEVGARVEAQDYLRKWYPSRIEKIDYDEGKMLVHFDRWSHRYDEWIFWDSNRLRPLERSAPLKEGQKDEQEISEISCERGASHLEEPPKSIESMEDQKELQQSRQGLRGGEEVLARWTDCRYYPAKIETVNKEGTYTVLFYDGVIRCVKRVHIRSMPEDAKGQDWIALVKAATETAQGKGAGKPRTSANSNRDKEEGRPGRSNSHTEEILEVQQSDPEKSVSVECPVEELKLSPEQTEAVKTKRKKSRHRSWFNPKKARLNKITVSKASGDVPELNEEQRGLAGTPEKGPMGGERESNTSDSPPAPFVQEHVPTLTASPSDSIDKQPERDAVESNSGQNRVTKSSKTTSAQGETPAAKLLPSSSLDLGFPEASHAGLPKTVPPCSAQTSEMRQQRRRSQRLVTCTPDVSFGLFHTPPSDGRGPDSKQSQTDSAMLEGDVCFDTTCKEKCKTPPGELITNLPPVPPSAKLPLPALQPPVAEGVEWTDGDLSGQMVVGELSPPLKAAAGLKSTSKIVKANKHSREPIINAKKLDNSMSPQDTLVDLDHKFKCKIPGCGKAFRKAKLLDYHLKYYHNADREAEPETGPPGPPLASVSCSAALEGPDNKTHRTVLASSPVGPQECVLLLDSEGCLKTPKLGKKKPACLSASTETSEFSLQLSSQDKCFECLHDKIPRKIIEKDKHLDTGLARTDKSQPTGKRKAKDKDRKEKKEKFPFRIKQKKKKKKKKKSKQHDNSDYGGVSLAFLERCSSPLNHTSSASSSKHTAFQYPRAILSVDLTGENLSDADFLENSTTESLLLSGDEYGSDFDSLTTEDFEEDEGVTSDIVRCICEMDEENGFMIQCEECMTWQHSVCMGLLEDSIPEQYICYVCRDPPGQRWSAKYCQDKDWMNMGHMYGLSFLAENYSHSNAKKIVSTHQLLADVYSVKKVLHGLNLKMDILQNKQDPNLHLWARSWVDSDSGQLVDGLQNCIHFEERLSDNLNEGSNPDTYITSEHSYQKPGGLGLSQDCWPCAGLLRLEERPELLEEEEEEEEEEEGQERTAITVSGFLNANSSEASEQAKDCVQWQLNLLSHIEDVQGQVVSRMDQIEKELDVLESWLDFTGELEPPDPLARLPQLKCRVKQLLRDLGKVQKISALCSV